MTSRDPELLGEKRGMHRPGAAERDQRELARIMAALDRDDAQRLGHAGVDDLDDAARRPPATDSPSGAATSRSIASLAPRRVDRQRAAEQRLAVEPAEHDIGVA